MRCIEAYRTAKKSERKKQQKKTTKINKIYCFN